MIMLNRTEQNRQALRHAEALIIATHVIANDSEAIYSVNGKHKVRCFGASNLFKRLLRRAKPLQLSSPMSRSDAKRTKPFLPLTFCYSCLAAFNLAEVLITIGIIGVVAAMTIPALLNKTNDAETITRVKKAYSIISQASVSVVNEEGPFLLWDRTDSSTPAINTIFSYYQPYFNIIKDCGNFQNGCWTLTKAINKLNTPWSNTYGEGANIRVFTLSDGMNISMDLWDGGYNTTLGVNHIGSNVLTFDVDVNGNIGPNLMGRDVFIFVQTDKGIIPAGKDDGAVNCTTSSGSNLAGMDCTAKVINEGAINY